MNDKQANKPTPIERLVGPFQQFAELEAFGGILLISCTVIALAWANSPWAASYDHLWHAKLTFGFANKTFAEPLHFWINDGLMAMFFLLVGLEIKRETLAGELASFKKAALPAAAALGGMLVPAAIYALINRGGPGASGWGIPMATDIAFALGIVALLGNRVSTPLRIFLAALAIADDIGAVLVIAFFYTETISAVHLVIAGLFLLALIALNRAGARHPLAYAILGIGLWVAFLNSGIHATVAGVLFAMTIPARRRIDSRAFLAQSEEILGEFRRAEEGEDSIDASAKKSSALHLLARDCERAESPMLRFEHALAPWVSYVIMPVFALANAGVAVGPGIGKKLVDPISLGIICGLVLGKPLGIVGFSWLSNRSGLAALPVGANWRQIDGIGELAGIGFTMSLFIADLAFGSTSMLEIAKVGILAGSIISGVAGAIILLQRTKAQ